MSKWEELHIEDLVQEILASSEPAQNQAHLGRPFLSAYQLAIELAHRHPDVAAAIGQPIGGQGTGQQTSLAQYLAGQLSRRIHSGEIDDIEGAVLADKHLRKMEFAGAVVSSIVGAYNLSMFRSRR